MGYTHYSRTVSHLDPAKFVKFSQDVAKVLDKVDVPLAREYNDPDTKPIINEQEIRFNGIGDDGHETFLFERDNIKPSWQSQKDDKVFSFCKTARKPYDLAVTACLVLAKHHFGKDVEVSSDGDVEDWEDGVKLVNDVLGYNKTAQETLNRD